MESIVRGHHIYKDRWCPYINEELTCQQEWPNYYDPFAVSVHDRETCAMCHLLRVSWDFDVDIIKLSVPTKKLWTRSVEYFCE